MWLGKKVGALLLLGCAWHSWADHVQVVGLFPGAAVVLIEGQQRLLKKDAAAIDGVRLIGTDARGATLELHGQERYLELGRAYSDGYAPAPRKRISLAKSFNNHYFASGAINGISTRMMVDTGATSVAMNSRDARRLGIDYIGRGELMRIHTASGTETAYRVMLRSVSVQGLEVRNVAASVLEGDYPAEILLGMSYLGELNMSFEDNLLVLEEKY